MGNSPITFIAPSPELRPFVAAYWHLETTDGQGGLQTYIPGISLAWIFNLKVPPTRLLTRGIECLPQSFVKGPTSFATYVKADGPLRNYGVAFNPGAASAFHRLPIGEMHNAFLDIYSIQDREFGQLARDVVSMSFSEAAQRFDWFLSARLYDADNADLGRLLFAELERKRRQPLSRLVEASGYSERHLRRLFRNVIGASPKTVSRISRLRRAVAGLSCEEMPLSQIAGNAGYCDQAHLNRDFREMIGCRPSAYRANVSTISKQFNSFDSNPQTDRSLH